MKCVYKIASVLLLIGGLNWGLVGLFDFDLVTWLSQGSVLFSRVVYSLVGASALLKALCCCKSAYSCCSRDENSNISGGCCNR